MATGFFSPTEQTPENVSARRKFALDLLKQGMDASPVQHWSQAVARAIQGTMGGYFAKEADDEGKAEQAKAMAALLGTLGGQQGATSSGQPPLPAPTGGPRSPTLPPMSQAPPEPPAAPSPYKVAGMPPPTNSQDTFRTPLDAMAPRQQGLASLSAAMGGQMTGMNPAGATPVPTQSITPPRQLAQSMAPPGGVPQVPQRAPTMPPASGGVPPGTMQTIQALSNPWLGAGGQAIGGKILEQQLKPRDQWQPYTAEDGTLLQKNATTGEIKAAGTENSAIAEVQYMQKNWKQLGLPDPASQEPKDRDYWQSAITKRLGGPGVNVSLSTEKKGGEELAQKGVQAYVDAQFAGRESQKRTAVYDRMDKAAEAFKPGASAEIRLGAQRWLKELGIAEGENVPEGEVLKMLGQQLAIHAQPKGQGAVSNFERDMFAKSLPNMTQSVEGFKKAVDISRSLEKFDMKVAEIYRESAKKNPNGIPNYLEVQEKIAGLGSPLSDSQMAAIQGGGGPPSQSSAPRAKNKAGDVIEWNGQSWVPVK